MSKNELWIKRKLAAAVASGIGRWADYSVGDLGKSIYFVEENEFSLTLLENGFTYHCNSYWFRIEYSKIESINLLNLNDIVIANKNINSFVEFSIKLKENGLLVILNMPFRVYSQVASVMVRLISSAD